MPSPHASHRPLVSRLIVPLVCLLHAPALVAQIPGPAPRLGHAMAYDSARQRVVLFGGNLINQQGNAGLSNETWEWDGSQWTQRFPATSPSPRFNMTMTYDAARGECVLFGGASTILHSDTWTWDGTTWTQMSPATIPPGRFHFAMTSDSVRNVVVMYGGNGPAGHLDDTWEWNGTNWSLVAPPPPNTGPGRRLHHAMCFDPIRNRVLLVGGYSNIPATPSWRDDLWSFDGTTWTLESGAVPGGVARGLPGFVWHAARQRALLFGGFGPGNLDDTVEWDGSTWTVVNTPLRPSARHYLDNAMVYDEQRQEAVLFGGWNGAPLGDTWTFDGTQWSPPLRFVTSPQNGYSYAATPPMSWTDAQTLATQVGARLATIRSASEETWLQTTFGVRPYWIGLGDQAVEGTYVWESGEVSAYLPWCAGQPNGGPAENAVLTGCGSGWSDENAARVEHALFEIPGGTVDTYAGPLVSTTTPPPATSNAAMVPLHGGGMLVVLGDTASAPPSSTYTLTGNVFTPASSILNPLPRRCAALCEAPWLSANVMFGGETLAGVALEDTWTFSTGQWSLVPFLTPRPAARRGHRLACDPDTNRVLLFGGLDATGTALADLWSFDGVAWTLLSTQGPTARFDHGLAYDPIRHRLALFAGDSGTIRLGDHWEWDGTAWMQMPVTTWSPMARSGHAMVFDPRSERLVVFGGTTANGCSQEVWTYDGAAWTSHLPSPIALPTKRGSAMAYDAQTNRLLVFSGDCTSGLANDLYELDLPVFSSTENYGTPCLGSAGALGLRTVGGSSAVLGQTFQVELTGVPFFSPCIGYVGFSATFLGATPLPIPLDTLSMPGCFAYQSADLSFFLGQPNNTTQTAQWPLAIPNDPIFLALHIYLQGLALEFTGRFATTTDAIDARIGNR